MTHPFKQEVTASKTREAEEEDKDTQQNQKTVQTEKKERRGDNLLCEDHVRNENSHCKNDMCKKAHPIMCTCHSEDCSKYHFREKRTQTPAKE